MTASFDDKVDALRRLREKRQARLAAEAKEGQVGGAGYETAEKAAVPVATAPEEPSTALAASAAKETRSGDADKKATPSIFAALAGDKAAAKDRPDPAGPGGEGEFDAIFMSGHCYERGIHGCEKDEAKAAEYYRIAAAEGHVDSQWRLAELLEFGRGVEQDDTEAAMWYRKAAEAGNLHAQAGLALMLEEGRGCELDEAEAFQWHLQAAKRGHALCQYCVSCCLEEGRGTNANTCEARRWLDKSADAGFKPALKKLSTLQHSGSHKERHSLSAVGDAAAFIANGSGGGGAGLTDIATRLAEQLKDLDDAEAEKFIDELLNDMPELFEGYGGATGRYEDSDGDDADHSN